jgi:hypothetical protein
VEQAVWQTRRSNIYERVKVQEKWTDRPVSIVKVKADGTMYLKDDRAGKFHISWYEGKNKKWNPRTCTILSDALRIKADSYRTGIVPECKTPLS